jgi:hypothetical protein
MIPSALPSSSKKRRLGLEDEIEEENADSTMNYGIRLLPRETPLSPGAAALSPIRPDDRRISNLPRRYSEIARSPPRFDAEAPPLPSLAGVMSGISSSHKGAANMKEDQKEDLPRVPGAFLTSTTENDHGSKELPNEKSPPPMFVFGSPAQKQVSRANFSEAINKLASPRSTSAYSSNTITSLPPTQSLPPIPKASAGSAENEAASWNDVNALQTVWAQLQARSGAEGAIPHANMQSISEGVHRPTGGMKRTDSTTRFQDLHEKQFAK